MEDFDFAAHYAANGVDAKDDSAVLAFWERKIGYRREVTPRHEAAVGVPDPKAHWLSLWRRRLEWRIAHAGAWRVLNFNGRGLGSKEEPYAYLLSVLREEGVLGGPEDGFSAARYADAVKAVCRRTGLAKGRFALWDGEEASDCVGFYENRVYPLAHDLYTAEVDPFHNAYVAETDFHEYDPYAEDAGEETDYLVDVVLKEAGVNPEDDAAVAEYLALRLETDLEAPPAALVREYAPYTDDAYWTSRRRERLEAEFALRELSETYDANPDAVGTDSLGLYVAKLSHIFREMPPKDIESHIWALVSEAHSFGYCDGVSDGCGATEVSDAPSDSFKPSAVTLDLVTFLAARTPLRVYLSCPESAPREVLSGLPTLHADTATSDCLLTLGDSSDPKKRIELMEGSVKERRDKYVVLDARSGCQNGDCFHDMTMVVAWD